MDEVVMYRTSDYPVSLGRRRTFTGLGRWSVNEERSTSRSRHTRFRLELGSPQLQVVPQQLHDERRVPVPVLGELVELRERSVERRPCNLARSRGVLAHIVVEHALVERDAETHRVRRAQVCVR